MRAVRLHRPGGIDNLALDDVEPTEPGPGDAIVRVHAAAITRDELEWPLDRLPAIPSYELSGVVEETGEEVVALTPFDRDGVAAEWAVVPARLLAPKPIGLSHVEAAALPMPALSAWQGLVDHGGLRPGERVSVTGARGGVGHVAVRLAESLGAEVVGEGEACDLLFDTAGGDALARAAERAGRVVTIAAEAPGATYFVVEPDGEQLRALPDLRPEVDSVFPLDEFRAAFERSAARGKRGKVVLDVSGG